MKKLNIGDSVSIADILRSSQRREPDQRPIGELMVTEEEIKLGNNFLDRIVRRLLVDRMMTVKEFIHFAKSYAQFVKNKLPNPAGSDAGNKLSLIRKGSLTLKQFFTVIEGIMGYQVLKVEITVADDKGVVKVLTDELVKFKDKK